MIVSLFRHTQSISIFLILILCIVLCCSNLILSGHSATEITNPLFNYIFTPSIQSNLIERIAVGILLFLQCMLMNNIMVKHKIITVNSLFPALFYFLIMCSLPNVISLNPSFIGMIFILLSIDKMIGIYLNNNSSTNIFDSSILISIAGLIHPPFLIFIILMWIGIPIFSQINIRKWILSIFGIACPWFILYTTTTFFSLDELNISCFFNITNKHNHPYLMDWGDIMMYTAYGFLIVISIIELRFRLRQKNIRSRQAYIFILWTLALSIIYFYIFDGELHNKLIIFSIPLSAIISNYFYYNKSKNLLNILGYSLIIIIAVNQFLL